MEICLGELQFNWCLIYLNDTIVFSLTLKEHLTQLRAVIWKLKEAGLKLKPSKCEFFKKSLTYLGHNVLEKGSENQWLQDKGDMGMAYSKY